VLAPLAALGQSKIDHDADKAFLGSASFKTYCASCHGTTARGDGPMADRLRFAPPDLTRIASRNGGRFPYEKVAKIIDGREAVKGHGGTDMPVWGDAFKAVGEGYDDRAVKQKIGELVQYLASLQAQK
jgi:mono/diheme cytochrome c family protein